MLFRSPHIANGPDSVSPAPRNLPLSPTRLYIRCPLPRSRGFRESTPCSNLPPSTSSSTAPPKPAKDCWLSLATSAMHPQKTQPGASGSSAVNARGEQSLWDCCRPGAPNSPDSLSGCSMSAANSSATSQKPSLCSCRHQHVGHHFGTDGHPGFILSILPSKTIIWNHGNHFISRSPLGGIDH